MTPRMIVAAFEEPGKAESTVDELHHEGFTDEQVGFALRDNRIVEAHTPTGRVEESGGRGAVIGALAGGTLGTLTGAVITSLIPGLGPVLTGGLLAGIATGAAAGAAAGAYLGPFIALEASQDEGRFIEQELRHGRTILVIKPTSVEQDQKARAVINEYGGREASLSSEDTATNLR